MTKKMIYKRWFGWLLVVIFYLLRHDFWAWNKVAPLVFGWMPPAFSYHFLYMIISVPVLYIFTMFCIPEITNEMLEMEDGTTV